MSKLINIQIRHEQKKPLVWNYIWLDPVAPGLTRKLVFSGMQNKKSLVNYGNVLNVEIIFLNKEGNAGKEVRFEMHVLNLESSSTSVDEYFVLGNICSNSEIDYCQGEIDVYVNWQNGKEFDWFNNMTTPQAKFDYIGACLTYSGLSREILDKDIYQFDMSLVKEERDFYYLAGLEFIGERGYMGHDFHTFKDCLLEVFHSQGFFCGKKILFLNSLNIVNPEIKELFEDLKKNFLEFKFVIA